VSAPTTSRVCAGSRSVKLFAGNRPEAIVRERLEVALVERLRDVLSDQPVTEAELRTLSERADGWARTLEGQIHASERRLRELAADPASSLADIAAELRRVETLGPDLVEVRSLLAELEQRAHRLRSAWLTGEETPQASIRES
jgi:hypothetical protein